MFSGATAQVVIVRLSGHPLLVSTVRAWVGVDWRGGKTRWHNGDEFFNVLAQHRLVIFDAHHVVGAVLNNQIARGLVLGVERVQGHAPPLKFPLCKELARHGYFVGLGIDHRAAQVKLGWAR